MENTFLGALNQAEKVGIGGTAVKLYNDFIQRGRTEPISQKDLSPTDIQSFKQLVEAKVQSTGSKQGKIDYKDYEKSDADTNILGGFRYKVLDNGDIEIKDTYDFNVNKGGQGENNELVQVLAAFVAPKQLAASIGRKVLPDTKGGVPVHIIIPK